MPTDKPVPGQRWVSDTEPELGLGIILKANFNVVEVLFPAANEHRQYAIKSAPLRRVQFKEGDHVQSHSGDDFVVQSIEERNGLLTYKTDKRDLPEAELSDAISFSAPEERLLLGQIDDTASFNLRLKALEQFSAIRHSPVRGYVGARVDLLPHQMFIAHEVSSRLLPRVLLADEVGLGKTIEACLILHRLHLTRRADRVLILLPEPLVNQWFVELYRRFHLLFSIFDEDRCASIQANDAEANPFLDSQLVIASLDFLANSPERASQAIAAGWDLIIADEAHHLEWTPTEASAEYSLVEALAAKAPGILLLSATPQQLGPEGHFARLRLLDPDRYASLEKFLEEAEHYQHVAKAADRLLEGGALSKADQKLFSSKSERIKRHCADLAGGNEEARHLLVSELLDEFGIGRVMFRNTRAALKNFPERQAHLYPLSTKDDDLIEPKVKWLAQLLKDLGEAKVLLICHSREMAEDLNERLLREINVNSALFHEGLTLLQRDRHAAHFADEEGARILICSEIGSEGRNFQFAHHLVLFDLPQNPELLEQRIGRLDRIGQTSTINIHVPYLKGTTGELLARWYHEGLDAFQKSLHGASEIVKALEPALTPLIEKFDAKKLTALIKNSIKQHQVIGKKMELGHDRLLELSSCQPEKASDIIEQIQVQDTDREFEDFFLRILDSFGLQVEDLSHRTYLITPGNKTTHALPGMPEEGLSVTFDRTRALSRENIAFMTTDHPLVRGALDHLLGQKDGNSAFSVWRASGGEGLMLEACFVVECPAPAALHVDRFLPPLPIRIVVDHAMKDQTETADLASARLEKGDITKLLDRGVVKKKIVPDMLKKAKALANARMTAAVESATGTMDTQLQAEIERLEDLQKLNDHVQPAEVDAMRKQQTDLQTALGASRLRLDALRLLWQMP
ncbi:RNA polymerase-binding ATPase [Phragmitibacter flavus]|uniref:RNA polymerase-binding ATPase n=1 Tax=Phragmitibacter flavus TaxID=2576071 RepID=A0A5R8KEE0_9BACT|nr:helicase-related protein [Phragmitibacter flavus]TLD70672.1 RNA polymerase-binding ATPase [Phragmitibacter flavus]